MITLVMGTAQQAGGDSLALQASPTVPAGETILRATATLSRAPGADVAVWTVDGARAGVSAWQFVRRRADGLTVWQTSIAATLAEGSHIVTVAFRAMSDTAAIEAAPAGGPGDTDIKLGVVDFALTNWLPGIMSGGGQSALDESVTVSGTGLKYVQVAISFKTYDAGVFSTASWYVSSTASPTTAQFGALYVGSSIIFRIQDCPAGVYSVYANLNIQGVTTATNTVTITVT